ncbi:hypothetical protein AN412_26065 [Klebsiella pneumoniae]|nr:hypothetical protein ABW15_24090 [Klebsiella pneumoniae]KRR31008.1 hypothetical protein AN412_26065 [Klebsiella pneumoniae]
MVQGDAVGIARIHFTSGQHRFHLADKTWEYFIQLQRFCVTEFTGNADPVSQIVQSVSLLYQTSAKARRYITIQSPLEKCIVL